MVRGIFGSSLLACYPAACVIYGVYVLHGVAPRDMRLVRIALGYMLCAYLGEACGMGSSDHQSSGSGMGVSDHILKPAHPP